MRYVNVNEFKGKQYVNIREYYLTPDGEERPGKKGSACICCEVSVIATKARSLELSYDQVLVAATIFVSWFACILGISLTPEQWEKLKSCMSQVDSQLRN